MNEKLYVCWRVAGGNLNHGEPIDSSAALDWVYAMGAKYPSIDHFTAPVCSKCGGPEVVGHVCEEPAK